MSYTTLLFEVRGHVAHITLNRPEAANSLNADLARDFMHAMLRCDEDGDIRAVVLSGAGRFFCTGGDLKSFAAQREDLPAHLKEVTTYFHAGISRMARMDAPVVAAVTGAAAGAGLSLACACDLVIAGASSRFTMAYTRAGLTPDGSSTYFLPRLVGLRRAVELTLTNRTLTAAEAEAWGIVTRVVPDEETLPAAEALAVELAAGATKTLGASKRLLMAGWDESLETQMEQEARTIAAMARTADGREGVAAFLAKRSATFQGR